MSTLTVDIARLDDCKSRLRKCAEILHTDSAGLEQFSACIREQIMVIERELENMIEELVDQWQSCSTACTTPPAHAT